MSVLVVAPPEPLVELEDVKAHLRVTTDDEDSLIESYIAAASAWIDGPAGWLARSIGEQTLEFRCDGFSFCDRLPYGPVIAVTEIQYVDPDGTEIILGGDVYDVAAGGVVLRHGATWPSLRGDAEGVRVLYQAGEAEVPAQVRQAILLLVGQWYRNRMSVVVGTISSALPFGVEALLAPLRRFS